MAGPIGRAQNRQKTRCANNHPLAGANLKLRSRAGYVERVCRECRRYQELRRLVRKRR